MLRHYKRTECTTQFLKPEMETGRNNHIMRVTLTNRLETQTTNLELTMNILEMRGKSACPKS